MILPALVQLDAAFSEGLRPDPLRMVDEWADDCRHLDTSTSAEPGQWRTSRVPFMREVMQALSPGSGIERVVMQAGAQVAKTEVGLNFIGHSIDDSPGPCLIVQPRDSDAEAFSKMRLAKMIKACPSLRAKVSDSKPGDGSGTLTLKEFPGGVLKLTGAQAPAGLRSMPVRRVFFDELDAAPDDCGGEGDPVELVDARTNTFGSNRKVYLCSTPTYADHSKIEREFLRGDQRRYFVPCPHCGAFQALRWKQVKWPEGKPLAAWYECEHCQAAIQNHHKDWAFPRGEWRATAPSSSPKIRSYHLSSLYSPHGWLGLGELAAKWEKAQGDPNALRAFINTNLGETWKPEGGQGLKVDAIMAARKGWGDLLPAGVAVLTAGVDVQGDRLEVEIVGWGEGEESWSVAYCILWGDPGKPAVWEALDATLDRAWPHALGGELVPAVTVIDSAGHSTAEVYAYVRTRSGQRRLACVGRADPPTGSRRPIWNNRPRRNNKGKIPLFVVGVDAAKEQVYGRLAYSAPGPGYCHYPPDRDETYFRGLTCERFERKVVRGKPRLVWSKPEGQRNEPLDLRVYALAGLHAWYALGYRIGTALDKLKHGQDPRLGRRPSAAPAPAPRPALPDVRSAPAKRKAKAATAPTWATGAPPASKGGWFNMLRRG